MDQRRSPDRLLGIGGVGLAFSGWAGPMIFPRLPEVVSYPMFAVGVAMAVYALWHGLNWHGRIGQFFRGSYSTNEVDSGEALESPAVPLSEFITLREAATEIYNIAQAHQHPDAELQFLTGWAEAAEVPIADRVQSPDDILNYMAAFLVQTHDVPLRGLRPPATVSRDLTRNETRHKVIADGAVHLRDKVNDQVVFKDLVVRRADLNAFIARRFGDDVAVPMPEAARVAYEELRAIDSPWAKEADGMAVIPLEETSEGVLLYMAAALQTMQTPIYGAHPPSRKRELIPHEEFELGGFGKSGATFTYYTQAEPMYVDIAVRKRDLDAAIERMKKEPPSCLG